MRNKIIYPILIIISIFAVVLLLAPVTVKAESSEPITIPEEHTLGRIISDSELADSQLKSSLLNVYNDYYNLPVRAEDGTLIISRLGTLRKNMFKDMDFSTLNGELNLSGTGGSKNGIVSLMGLELIDFSTAKNLTKINLSNNSITSIARDNFASLGFIEEVDFSDNNIEAANLDALTNLRVLKANNNRLTELNLNFLKAETSPAYVNLSNNNIEDLTKLQFKNQDLLNNPINLYMINSLKTYGEINNSKVLLHGGLVGYESTVIKYSRTGDLVYYPITNVAGLGFETDNIRLIIKDYNNLNGEAVYSIDNNTITTKQEILEELPIGKYSIYFEDNNGNSIIDKCEYFVDKYSAYVIEVVPYTPTITVSQNGENITFHSGDVIENNVTVTLSTTDANAEIWYQIDGKEWQKGTEVEIVAGGYRTLAVKSIVNGIESREEIYSFQPKTGFGMKQLITIGLCTVGLLGIYFGLLPLVRYFINKPIVIKSKKDKES